MTTITAVVKDGFAAIAADTLSKWGNLEESAQYIVNCSKIIQVANSSIAISGPTSAKVVLAHYFATAEDIDLQSVHGIYRTWQRLHEALRDRYFLTEADEESAFESSQFEVLIANETGAYAVTPHRAVQKLVRFMALGGGGQYAVGAMYAHFLKGTQTAEEIARLGVEAAAEFEENTGLPVHSRSVALTSK